MWSETILGEVLVTQWGKVVVNKSIRDGKYYSVGRRKGLNGLFYIGRFDNILNAKQGGVDWIGDQLFT